VIDAEVIDVTPEPDDADSVPKNPGA